MGKDRSKTICFDTETTGIVRSGSDPDEILTLSIVDGDGKTVFDEMFRPSRRKEWPRASEVNGILPSDVAGCEPIESHLPELMRIFADADEVIGYNVGFDLEFLENVGVRPRPDAEVVDTMMVFSEIYGEPSTRFPGEFRWKKLTFAAEHIGHEWTGAAHGSLADAVATLAVQRWCESQA